MNAEQGIVFAILFGMLILFVSGVWRYDVVALLALLTAVLSGVVATEEAFSGFAHPAVITVGAVLVISRGLQNAGVVDWIASGLTHIGSRPWVHILVMSSTVALLSGFINNIGALALLMPAAIGLARSHDRPPGYLLMPMAFASQMGGLTTLIGTPANLIISESKSAATGEPFSMFSFTPLGFAVSAAGVASLTLAAPWLIPKRRGAGAAEDLFEIQNYTTELTVPKNAKAIGKRVSEIEEEANGDVLVLRFVRGGFSLTAPSGVEVLEEGDTLLVEADADALKLLTDKLGLTFEEAEIHEDQLKSGDNRLMEAVIRPGSRLVQTSAQSMLMRSIYGINLLAVAREGARVRDRLSRVRFRTGDVLLLQGPLDSLRRAVTELECYPLADRAMSLGKPRRIVLGLAVFAAAVVATASGAIPVELAFCAAGVAMILGRLIDVHELYTTIEWPVIVLLACLVPVGGALQSTGGDQIIANGLTAAANVAPFGATALVAIATMVLSNLVNNAGVAIVMAPVALRIADGLDAAPESLLMAVALGASSAFLTPVGHQSNALVMGPGGYHFRDFAPLGIAVSVAVITAAVPVIHWFW
ncbi:MAG: anion permease [Bryobacteraceae bacterium]|nr:anion permease [Bryobacteraceae bacterium]